MIAQPAADDRHVAVPLLPVRHVRGLAEDGQLRRPEPAQQRDLQREARLVVPPGDDERRVLDLAEPAGDAPADPGAPRFLLLSQKGPDDHGNSFYPGNFSLAWRD